MSKHSVLTSFWYQGKHFQPFNKKNSSIELDDVKEAARLIAKGLIGPAMDSCAKAPEPVNTTAQTDQTSVDDPVAQAAAVAIDQSAATSESKPGEAPNVAASAEAEASPTLIETANATAQNTNTAPSNISKGKQGKQGNKNK